MKKQKWEEEGNQPLAIKIGVKAKPYPQLLNEMHKDKMGKVSTETPSIHNFRF